jgi:hypothetical protein
MGFRQYTWIYSASGYRAEDKGWLPFPFVYQGVEYDLNKFPYAICLSNNATETATGAAYFAAVQGSFVSLGYSSYSAWGYPLLMYNSGDNYNIDSAYISGKYRIPQNIESNYMYGSCTIIVNFAIDGVNKRYFVLCGGRDWGSKQTHTPLNYFTAGFGYEYPTLKTSSPVVTPSADYKLLNTSLTSAQVRNDYVGKIIDFGETPQLVPKYFKDWLDSAFTPIYPYSYTVKDFTGEEILSSISESPSMTNAQLTVVGSQKTLTLTGSNGNPYTLVWNSNTPEGKQFLGLSNSPKSNRVIVPANFSTPVSWIGDVVLYESYGNYRPPATTFDINLYQNSAEVNRVDKSNYLVGVGTLSGALREECSMLTPSIVYQSSDVPTFNYVYIPIFNRYYYVTSLSSVGKNLWRMELNCDVLMTYKNEIFLLQGVIGRQEIDFNPLLVDNELPTQNNPIVEVIDIPSDAFNTQTSDAGHNYVITVIGA